MAKFKPGDKVWVIVSRTGKPLPREAWYKGLITGIKVGSHLYLGLVEGFEPHPGGGWQLEEAILRPRNDDDYREPTKASDGTPLAKWKDCAWQPKALKNKEKVNE